MVETMNRPRQGMAANEGQSNQRSNPQEAREHSEGTVARTIEEQTAKLPSDVWLWAAIGSMGASLLMHCTGRREDGHFFGQWAAPFLLLGVYNKIVKVSGSDRVHQGHGDK